MRQLWNRYLDWLSPEREELRQTLLKLVRANQQLVRAINMMTPSQRKRYFKSLYAARLMEIDLGGIEVDCLDLRTR